MDTRAKIKIAAELHSLLAQDAWTILIGEFDPVTAEVADTIEQVRTPGLKLLVVLRSNPDELLSAEARALLVAGFRSVDAVFVAGMEDWRCLVPKEHARVVEDGTRRRAEFEALVLASQGAAAQA